MSIIAQIFTTAKEVLTKRNYLLGFFIFIPVIFSIFVLIPVLTIPANSISFQLSIFTIRDYTLISTLSILASFFIILQIYTYKIVRDRKERVKVLGQGAVGGYGGLVAAVFGTAACASCLAALFGFLGLGTVFFLIRYQWLICSGAILLILISIYFTSKKCASCITDSKKEN